MSEYRISERAGPMDCGVFILLVGGYLSGDFLGGRGRMAIGRTLGQQGRGRGELTYEIPHERSYECWTSVHERLAREFRQASEGQMGIQGVGGTSGRCVLPYTASMAPSHE